MSSSLLEFFRSGPPAPSVALLPDSHFFVRTVQVEEGADAVAVASQVELALETMSPFPVAQLYHGHFWVPGAGQVLVFAAYRRRFMVEETDAWRGVEWVSPTFATVLGLDFAPATTVIVPGSDSLTAVSWDKSPVPRLVLVRALPPEADAETRQLLRDELVREVGGTVRLIELPAQPEAVRSPDENRYAFRSGDVELTLQREACLNLDVRPKDELAQLRRAKQRDLLLWRIFMGTAAAVGLLLLGEGAIFGGAFWQKSRMSLFNSQRPVVEKIMTAQALSNRIDELSTKRLLPFEMISVLNQKRPKVIQFLRTTTVGLFGMEIDARTANATEVSAYKAALAENAAIESVEVKEERSRDQLTTFTLVVKFKPEAMKSST